MSGYGKQIKIQALVRADPFIHDGSRIRSLIRSRSSDHPLLAAAAAAAEPVLTSQTQVVSTAWNQGRGPRAARALASSLWWT